MEKEYKKYLDEKVQNLRNSGLAESELVERVKGFFDNEVVSMLTILGKSFDESVSGLDRVGDICNYAHDNAFDDIYGVPVFDYQIAGSKTRRAVEDMYNTKVISREMRED